MGVLLLCGIPGAKITVVATGDDADEASKILSAQKIPRHLIKDAMEIALRQGAYTIFAMVDALTQLTQKVNYAGDRAELDARIGGLLALAV